GNSQDREREFSRHLEWDEKTGRPIYKNREPEWDERSNRSLPKELREKEFDERSERSERSIRLLQKENRDSDWDDRSSLASPRDRRIFEHEDKSHRLRVKDSKESLNDRRTSRVRDSEWDERGQRIPRDSRKNEWDSRGPRPSPKNHWENHWDERIRRPSPKDMEWNNSRSRGMEWNNNGRRMSKDSNWTETTDRETYSEGPYDDNDSVSEFELAQSRENYKEKRSMSEPMERMGSPLRPLQKESQKTERVVSPPHVTHRAMDLDEREFKNLNEVADVTENSLNEESTSDNLVEKKSNRTSIYITDDVWKQLSNTLDGTINPFFVNPEERFKNGNEAEAVLSPIQEVEIPELLNTSEGTSLRKNTIIKISEKDNSTPLIHSEDQKTMATEANIPVSDTSNVNNLTDSIEKKDSTTVVADSSATIVPMTEEPSQSVSTESKRNSASTASKRNSVSSARERALKNIESMQYPSVILSPVIWNRFLTLDIHSRNIFIDSSFPVPTQERKLLLVTLLAHLNNHEVDYYLFRKLTRLSKEISLKNRELADDIWEYGERFGELMNALIGFLTETENSEMKENAIILLAQFLENQFDYILNQRLERDILRVLIECRAESSNAIYFHAEEILENYVQRIDSNAGLYALIDIMESNLFKNKADSDAQSRMKASAFVVLSRIVMRFDKGSLKRQIGIIVPLTIKGFGDSSPSIRKSVVDALVALYLVLGDDNTFFEYLRGLSPAQLNLLYYYFDKNRSQPLKQRQLD
ncbi:3969_t:CDS:2, partial [Acaulospora morrowiae]